MLNVPKAADIKAEIERLDKDTKERLKRLRALLKLAEAQEASKGESK